MGGASCSDYFCPAVFSLEIDQRADLCFGRLDFEFGSERKIAIRHFVYFLLFGHYTDHDHPMDESFDSGTSIECESAVIVWINHSLLGLRIIGSIPLKLLQQVLARLARLAKQSLADEARRVLWQPVRKLSREQMKKTEDELRPLIQCDYIAISRRAKVVEAIDLVKERLGSFKDKSSYLYVVDERHHLKGVLQMQDLLVSAPECLVEDLMESQVVSVSQDATKAQAAELFRKFPYFAIPVVDANGCLTGVISERTLKPFVSQMLENKLYRFTRFTEEEIERKSIFEILARRLPWLGISLLCGLTCAYLLGMLIGKIETVVALILFVPIVLGLSGSVGTQSAAIVGRGLKEGKLALSGIGKIFLKEAGAAFAMSGASAAAVILFSLFWKKGPKLGLAFGLALLMSMIVSGLLGMILPIIFRLFRIEMKSSGNFGSGLFLLLICDTVALICYFLITLSILDPIIEIA